MTEELTANAQPGGLVVAVVNGSACGRAWQACVIVEKLHSHDRAIRTRVMRNLAIGEGVGDINGSNHLVGGCARWDLDVGDKIVQLGHWEGVAGDVVGTRWKVCAFRPHPMAAQAQASDQAAQQVPAASGEMGFHGLIHCFKGSRKKTRIGI